MLKFQVLTLSVHALRSMILSNQGGEPVKQYAMVLPGFILILATACVSTSPAPGFDPDILMPKRQSSEIGHIDPGVAERLKKGINLVNDHFGATGASNKVFYSNNKSWFWRLWCLPLYSNGTTKGIGEINVSASMVPSTGLLERIDPVVLALTAEGQRALLASSDRNTSRSIDDMAKILKVITRPKEPGDPVNPRRPEYLLTIASEVTTDNIFDRFDRIDTLVLLDTDIQKKVRIGELASLPDSLMTMDFGQITREQRSKLALTGGVSGVPLGATAAAGTGAASGSYELTYGETLQRKLDEKMLTTNVSRLPDNIGQGFWIVQRGFKDHKLCHILPQRFTLEIDEPEMLQNEHGMWTVDEKTKTLVHYEIPPMQRVGLHVFSVGHVRHIKYEGWLGWTKWVFNEKHTVEEGDDWTHTYVITNYQYILLPLPYTPIISRVAINDSNDNIMLTEKELPHHSASASFKSRENRAAFMKELTTAKWTDGSKTTGMEYPSNVRGNACATVMGAWVMIDNTKTVEDVRRKLDNLYFIDEPLVNLNEATAH